MDRLELEEIKYVAELPLRWELLKNKTLLISGGTGLIGSFLENVFRYRNENYGDNIKVVSISRRGGNNDLNVKHVKCNIVDGISYDGKIDYILHLASNSHPKQYAEDPVGTITTNIIGCNNLLKFAYEKKVERFLLASSVEIYGQGSEDAMDESYSGYIDCNSARSGYNEAKRTCEALCQSYISQFGVNCVIARLARVIGFDKKNDTKAMSQFMNKAIMGEDIVLKSKGNQRYSFIYIADAVSAILNILLDGECGNAYNVSGEDEGKTLGEYANFIASLAGKKVVYEIEDNSSVSKATYAILNCSKLEKLGWRPNYSISEGLERIYNISKNV